MLNYEELVDHPIAEELPDMPEAEYRELVNDIRENGLRDKIVCYEGMILDGRHRYRALKELGYTLDEDVIDEYDPELDGPDPARFAVSRNIMRRHLSSAQRAGVASSLLSRAGGVRKGRPKKNGNGMSVAEAAKAAGVSARNVTTLLEIERVAPEVAAEVKAGKKTIPQGHKEATAKVIAPEYEKSLKRIAAVCGTEFHTQIANGGIKMQPQEVVEYAALKDEAMLRLMPVLEGGELWAYAKSYDTMEVTLATKLGQLHNLCLLNGGKLVDEQNGFKTVVTKIKEKKIK